MGPAGNLVVTTDGYRCTVHFIRTPSGTSRLRTVHLCRSHSPSQERRLLSPAEFATLLRALDALAKLPNADEIKITFAASPTASKDRFERVWRKCMPNMFAKGPIEMVKRPGDVARGKRRDLGADEPQGRAGTSDIPAKPPDVDDGFDSELGPEDEDELAEVVANVEEGQSHN